MRFNSGFKGLILSIKKDHTGWRKTKRSTLEMVNIYTTHKTTKILCEQISFEALVSSHDSLTIKENAQSVSSLCFQTGIAKYKPLLSYCIAQRLTAVVNHDFLGKVFPELLQNVDRQTRVYLWFRHDAVSLIYPLASRAFLTLRWLMSYIYGAPILDVSRSHTTTQHSR